MSTVSALHLVHDWYGRRHGFGAIPRELSLAQQALGATVEVGTVSSRANLQHRIARPSPEVTVVGHPPTGPSSLGFSIAGMRWAMSDGAARYQVLHQHGIWNGISLMAIAWRKGHRGPTIVAPQGSLTRYALRFSRWKKHFALRAYERANLERAGCLHATSPQEAECFRRLKLTNPIAIIPNGVSARDMGKRGEARRFIRAHELSQSASHAFSLPPPPCEGRRPVTSCLRPRRRRA